MIYKKCIMTINKNNATLDEDIYLFRLDKNIELHFSIVNNRYKFDKSDLNNIIAQTNAAYFQIRLYRSDEIKYTFAIQPTQDGVAVLTITDDLINDPIELGEYDFQISLLDADKTSMISMPIVKQQLHVCEPLVDNQAIMGRAVLGLSSLASGEIKNAFDSEGNYIREIHNDGDILSAQLINKFEEALDTNTKASKDLATKKYVDDKVTVKILPVDYDKNCATNVADLEPHSIYMSPNDAKFLYLGYERLGGSFSGFFLSGNPHGKFIYTGAKDDTKIEVVLDGICYTAYFKTDTVDAHTEKTVYYLTKNNNKEFTPTTDYEPATKKYVDDNKIAYTISSKVLTTVPASSIKLDEPITVNNITLNKDRKYYIEFLGSKGLCNLLISEEMGNCIICNIGNYTIQAYNNSTNIKLVVIKINEDDTTTDTFTDLIIYEEEVKYLDSKYLETDLVLQNSISLGRIGDIGAGSSAVGYNTTASGDFSHAEGDNTIASASGTHAEGGNTTASGNYSHAEGSGTIASGMFSHAEGSTTTASGVNSHAEGDYTTASGASSHAEGYGIKASSQFQHVQGKYNIEDTNRRYAHIVGNGAGDAKRSNAHTLDWKGNAWYSGKLSQEGTPTEDKDLTTKKYVDDNILLEQLPILRIDETNKRIYVNCNNMGTYKKYFVPNKYANVYGFSFIYTNEDSSETEIALISGAMTKDDFILCTRNTDTLFILILGGTNKYTYTKSTKTLEKGLYGYLKIGNTQEYAPTENYNPATKKYVDDKVSSLPQLSFNEAGELVVTINGVSKTFVPKS